MTGCVARERFQSPTEMRPSRGEYDAIEEDFVDNFVSVSYGDEAL